MSDQPPRVPDDFERYFRNPDSAGDVPPGADYDAYERMFRQSPPDPRRGPDRAGTAPPGQPRQSGPTTAAPGAPARVPHPKRRPSLWRRALRWTAVLLLLVLGYAGFLVIYLVANIDKVDALPDDRIGNTSGAVTLIVGSDERSNDPAGGSRTDTIMLMVDPLFGAPTLVSIPRDSWVEIPGEGNGKINSAFSIGGPPLLIETVEANTGLRVDHYMEIGFGGVVQLTDAVGGVRLCIDYDVDDPLSGLVMQAGCSVLEGQQALAFVRMRYSDPQGDLGRIERQQQWIASFITTVLRPQVLLNPFTMIGVMDAGASAVKVDQATGPINLGRFGWAMLQIGRGSGALTTVPVADSSAWRGGQSVVLWDDSAADQLFDSLGAR